MNLTTRIADRIIAIIDEEIHTEREAIKLAIRDRWDEGDDMELDDYFAIIDFQGEE